MVLQNQSKVADFSFDLNHIRTILCTGHYPVKVVI